MNKRLAIILTAMFCIFGIVETGSAQTAAEKAVNAYIRKEYKSAESGTEYKKARKIVLGDVDGDGDKDAVVQYTIEGMGGGTGFGQTLAVFLNTKGGFKFQSDQTVGGKFAERTSILISVKTGKILVSTESCEEPPQGMCKNPKKGKATFKLVKGILTEL